MTDAVVVVGPATLRGPRVVDPDRATLALDCIDDELALVDDRVVRVDRLWRDVLGEALNGRCAGVVLILPSWWATSRAARVETAAREWTPNVTVHRRADLSTAGSTVIEVAPDMVVVHADAQRQVVTRVNASDGVVEAVLASIVGLDAVTIDIPSGVTRFGAELSRAVRRRGIDVVVTDDHALIRVVRARRDETRPVDGRGWRHVLTPRAAVTAGALLVAIALVSAAAWPRPTPRQPAEVTWLVEGRVAVQIPVGWTVERITSGPGSARVRVMSPPESSGPSGIIYVTQARVADDESLAGTAETLRLALAEEPDGVFVDFAPLGSRAQRPVVSYREIRAERRVAWTVLLDRGVRIAIGCENPNPEQEQACDQAIGSARAVS